MKILFNRFIYFNASLCSLISVLFVFSFSLFLNRVVYAETKTKVVVQLENAKPINSAVFSHDSKFILTASDDNIIRLWDLDAERDSWVKILRKLTNGWHITTVEEIKRFQGHRGSVYSAMFSSDAANVLSGSQDTTLKLWDVKEEKELKTLGGQRGMVLSVSLSPDGKYALSGDSDGEVALWDILTGKIVRFFSGHKGTVFVVAFSPDGKYALSGGEDKVVRIWSLETWKELQVFGGHTGAVMSAAFSPDGDFVVSGSGDYTIKLWDFRKGKEKTTLKGHEDIVRSVAFSNNGKYIISGSNDKTVRIFDTSNGNEMRLFGGHKDAVNSVAFSPDGKFALSGSKDGTTRIWNPVSGKELFQFASFTGNEWVIVTPEGYYDVSDGGEKYLSVQVGNRTENIAGYQKTYRRADIIEAALSIKPFDKLEPIEFKKPPPPPPQKKTLGLLYQKVPAEMVPGSGLEAAEGVLVTHVVEASPADKGGIKVGDIVALFGGKLVNTNNFMDLIQNSQDGKKIKVGVVRNETWVNKIVVLGENPSPAMSVSDIKVAPDIKVERIRFFESGRTIPLEDKRTYRATFDSLDTRFVCWELDLSHPGSETQRKISIEAVCYTPDGSIGSRVETGDFLITPKTFRSILVKGFARDRNQPWKAGTYKVEILINGQKIATDSFNIE